MIYKSAQVERAIIICTSDNNTLFYYTIDASFELYTSINALILGGNEIVEAYKQEFIEYRNNRPIDCDAYFTPRD